jgi:DNA-binding transcriptional ArsR family regulator
MNTDFVILQDMLKALVSENRQRILLEVFGDGQPRTVNQIAEQLGLGQSTASEHLTQMKRAGILRSQKVGKEVLYRPDRSRLLGQLQGLTELVERCCPPD